MVEATTTKMKQVVAQILLDLGACSTMARGRWSARRRYKAVMQPLPGEDLETLSSNLGPTTARLSDSRDAFLASGEAQLKPRACTSRDREVLVLQRKLGELTIENELLREKAPRLEVSRLRRDRIFLGGALVSKKWGAPP